ncbi:hypothetical protein F5878DRAFT_205032 [Lentinula raphanica]|uniref:Uncharacterized protein n=1 Tax=Lentinula raphanica TaxID=153919 RepID=A0AA38P7C2_9AGAR|nr:hypothetical protein F5878DRAFT_205032 [Lentinula raphanica]
MPLILNKRGLFSILLLGLVLFSTLTLSLPIDSLEHDNPTSLLPSPANPGMTQVTAADPHLPQIHARAGSKDSEVPADSIKAVVVVRGLSSGEEDLRSAIVMMLNPLLRDLKTRIEKELPLFHPYLNKRKMSAKGPMPTTIDVIAVNHREQLPYKSSVEVRLSRTFLMQETTVFGKPVQKEVPPIGFNWQMDFEGSIARGTLGNNNKNIKGSLETSDRRNLHLKLEYENGQVSPNLHCLRSFCAVSLIQKEAYL